MWGLPTVGTQPAGEQPPLHALQYYRCAKMPGPVPCCLLAGKGEGLSSQGSPVSCRALTVGTGTGTLEVPGIILVLVSVSSASMLTFDIERERENFTSPFSQHWLMRTRLCWSHQPKEEECRCRSAAH